MPTETIRINITLPADWHAAWEKAAARAGAPSLSEWIGDRCNADLPESVRAKLSERSKRGKRAKPAA